MLGTETKALHVLDNTLPPTYGLSPWLFEAKSHCVTQSWYVDMRFRLCHGSSQSLWKISRMPETQPQAHPEASWNTLDFYYKMWVKVELPSYSTQRIGPASCSRDQLHKNWILPMTLFESPRLGKGNKRMFWSLSKTTAASKLLVQEMIDPGPETQWFGLSHGWGSWLWVGRY